MCVTLNRQLSPIMEVNGIYSFTEEINGKEITFYHKDMAVIKKIQEEKNDGIKVYV